MSPSGTTVDVVAFGPHPDDVELAMGGTLLKLAAAGYRTAIVDLTAGELGTRGTPEVRAREAADAARILRAETRTNLDLGDGRLSGEPSAKRAVVEALRRLRPRLVFTNYPENNHPDHAASGRLVAEAAYLAGLAKWDASGSPHRPHRVIYYFVPRDVRPSFIVDVSAHHSEKMRAVRAHASQFYDPSSSEPDTFGSQPGFLGRIEGADRYHGALIDADFGEAFYLREAIAVDDPVSLFDRTFTRFT